MASLLQLSTDALALIPQDANCAAECETLIRDAGESFGALSDAMSDASVLLRREGREYVEDLTPYGRRHGVDCIEAADLLAALSVATGEPVELAEAA